jgi:hypothetical protein
MLDRFALVLRWLRALCRLQGGLALENLALRQQLTACPAAIHARD